MRKIHYFQRYQQRENWMTNSALLLMNRLYLENIIKFKKFINLLLEDANVETEFGVNFGQQIHNNFSVPDGMISQSSIQILIETKLESNLDYEQLINHLNAFNLNVNQKILMGLSKYRADRDTVKALVREIKNNKSYKGIKFISTTYNDIYKSFKQVINDNDYELNELIEDFYELCIDQKLVDDIENKMMAVAASNSINENLRYNIYYDPVERKNKQKFKYLGLYNNKSIVAIGKVKDIVECDYQDNELIVYNNTELNQDEKERIINIINETEYYDISQGKKFYLIEKFYDTDFRKITPGPMRNKNYFDIGIFLNTDEFTNAKELADKLNGLTWE